MPSAFASLLFALSLPLTLAATMTELFQKAKEEFKYGSYAASLATLETLESASAVHGHEAERSALWPGLLFYRGANLAALGRADEARQAFDEFLAYQPTAQLDPAVYPKAVIAAFESARNARQERRPAEGPILAEAYRTFPRPQTGLADTVSEDWAQGPVRYLLSPGEARDFTRLADPMSRSEFIVNFWKTRDPRPETPENEFREEFEKRVAFADARFGQDETRGSLTDRGMVFILMGPPSYSGRRAMTTGDDTADAAGLSRYTPSEINAASQYRGSTTDHLARMEQVSGAGTKILDAAANWIEVWHYRREALPDTVPYQEVLFQFITKQGYGKNVLQRDASVLVTLERSRPAPHQGS